MNFALGKYEGIFYDSNMEDRVLLDYCSQLKISQRFGSLLLARGLNNIDDARKYLHPSIEDMQDPFAILGMKEAVARIKKAIANKEKILIFGDYDCDGISAISILMLYLQGKTPVDYYIPNRNVDGYGLSSTAIDSILTSSKPSLVITVDCGITSVAEAKYLKEHGIDIIVTDHHEPQDVLPDCIIVDPKIERKGFYDYCGAGVALKLVEALSSREEIVQYFDICALATIADLVPLTGENRIIAYYGLKQIKERPRLGIKLLLGEENISSYTVMFRLAPRINSAGRLDSAMKVVDLFISNDPILLRMLVEELGEVNARRQAICDQVFSEAMEMLKNVNFNKTRIIILEKDDWEAGVIGISASRIMEVFKRPTILLAKKEDGLLRGSSRSIKSVNIFDLLTRLSDLLEAYGGHAQAAGVTIKKENLEEFKQRANDILLSEHDDSEFLLKESYDTDLELDNTLLSFSKELELLEPTGYGNPKPVFRVIADDFKFDRIGFSNHIKYSKGDYEIIGFNCLNKIGSLEGGVELEVTLSNNIYQNREYAQCTIKTVRVTKVDIEYTRAQLLNIHQLAVQEKANIPLISINAVKEKLNANYGNLFICFSNEDYENLIRLIPQAKDYSVSIGEPMTLNPENSILICPKADMDYSYFERVFIAGNPISTNYFSNILKTCEEVYTLDDYKGQRIVILDNIINSVYTEIKRLMMRGMRLNSLSAIYINIKKSINVSYFTFAVVYQILAELGVITFNDKGRIEINYDKKDRNSSITYQNTRP